MSYWIGLPPCSSYSDSVIAFRSCSTSPVGDSSRSANISTMRWVQCIATNLAMIDVTDAGFALRELAPDTSRAHVAARTGATLRQPVAEMGATTVVEVVAFAPADRPTGGIPSSCT